MESVLFVCTHNSARSQMAEGWLRHLGLGRYVAASAGAERRSVHPLATEVMAEAGVDLSEHRSKTVEEVLAEHDGDFDTVVTVCDAARAACPYVPARRRSLHHSFADPSAVEGTREKRLAAFRAARDEIRAWVEQTFMLDPRHTQTER